jgi:hypothetical protein
MIVAPLPFCKSFEATSRATRPSLSSILLPHKLSPLCSSSFPRQTREKSEDAARVKLYEHLTKAAKLLPSQRYNGQVPYRLGYFANGWLLFEDLLGLLKYDGVPQDLPGYTLGLHALCTFCDKVSNPMRSSIVWGEHCNSLQSLSVQEMVQSFFNFSSTCPSCKSDNGGN